MLTPQQVKFVGQYIQRNAPHHGSYWSLRHAKKGGWAVFRPNGSQLILVGTLSEYPTYQEALAVVSRALQSIEVVEVPVGRLNALSVLVELLVDGVARLT